MNVKSQTPRKIAEPTSVFKSEQIGFLQRRSTKQDEITSFPTSVYEVLRSPSQLLDQDTRGVRMRKRENDQIR